MIASRAAKLKNARNRSQFLMLKPNSPNPSAMVVPFRHVETPFEFTADEWADFGEMLVQAKLQLTQF